MGFSSLFVVASMPILEVLLISCLGAFLATGYCNVLTPDARRYINKVVFIVFTPSLMFASLVKSVTLEDIVSWWFMPVNIGLSVFFGAVLGWIAVKITKPERYLEGLIVASCSSGNLGNLMIIIIPAICNEDGSPFGEQSVCSVRGISYASFSMALGGFYIWTYGYNLIRTSSLLYKESQSDETYSKIPHMDLDAGREIHLLTDPEAQSESGSGQREASPGFHIAPIVSTPSKANEGEIVPHSSSGKLSGEGFWKKLRGSFHTIVKELTAPPTIGSFIGFAVGATPQLKSLVVGSNPPLKVIQDVVTLLGNGTIPCITLILGGNLTEGMRKSKIKYSAVFSVICVRYVILPIIGIGIVKLAGELGLLSPDPLYRYVLMIQFTIPPAMNLGTMAQFFNVAEQECSVIFLWTYAVAAISLTVWSTIYLWILS
ncbi:hypothetical protein AMTRI_Chr09g33700 [Amborella trichopoda]|uniref:Auxin efflux carrier n=1 Tax=Amborella trichopoda TaxID=13333 RepID=U5CV03_AMBTC|nr:protein PIN-LIKES 7 [Amborella trichopoda]ERN17141.1 hypothetical protein AMTR_s00044p00126910 [Amborella trichopoda]|eukprot:XP_006855674.1 protein PIN-LIKES 7 [Amborella trichopoda]